AAVMFGVLGKGEMPRPEPATIAARGAPPVSERLMRQTARVRPTDFDFSPLFCTPHATGGLLFRPGLGRRGAIGRPGFRCQQPFVAIASTVEVGAPYGNRLRRRKMT